MGLGGSELLLIRDLAIELGVAPAKIYQVALRRGHGPDMRRIGVYLAIERWAGDAIARFLVDEAAKGETRPKVARAARIAAPHVG